MIETQAKVLPLYHNGRHIGTIPLHDALLAAESEDIALTWKGRGRKARITAAHMLSSPRTYRPSCTITRAETENNAFVHEGVRLSAKDAIRTFDAAVAKVTAWPEIYDDRTPVIAAGKAYGVIQCSLPDDRVVTFA